MQVSYESESTFQISYVLVCAHKVSAAMALCKGLDGNVAIMGLFKDLFCVYFTCYILTIGSLKK